jgi:hypothetical protein
LYVKVSDGEIHFEKKKKYKLKDTTENRFKVR